MKKMIIRFAAVVLFCSLTPVKPISENTAKYGAIAGGVVVGAAAGVGGWYFLEKVQHMDRMTSIILGVLAGGAAGGLTWWMLDAWLQTLTPRGKYLAALKVVTYVELDSLTARDFATIEELISHVNARFGSSWPLVLAREHCMSMASSLNSVLSSLQSAYYEAKESPEYATLCNNIQTLQEKIDKLAKRIEVRVNVIVGSQEYQFQVKLYEKHMEAERERAHQAKLKQEDRWHDSAERERDRDFTAREKNKDRLSELNSKIGDRNFKREVLNNYGAGPVMLNI